MPSIHADAATLFPRLEPQTGPLISDDECVSLLAKAIDAREDDKLDEVAWLIGRLAVSIEQP